MREDVDHRDLHDRGQPDGRTAVVAEDQEAGAVGAYLREREAVQDGAHGVLANAEMQVPPGIAAGPEVARALEGEARLGRRREIGRATEQPGDVLGDGVEDLRGGVPAGHTL